MNAIEILINYSKLETVIYNSRNLDISLDLLD